MWPVGELVSAHSYFRSPADKSGTVAGPIRRGYEESLRWTLIATSKGIRSVVNCRLRTLGTPTLSTPTVFSKILRIVSADRPHTAASSEDENCFSTTVSDGRQNFSWTYTRSPGHATNSRERRTFNVNSRRVSLAVGLLRIKDVNSCPNGNIPSPRRPAQIQQEE
jgi:hypothetical protein